MKNWNDPNDFLPKYEPLDLHNDLLLPPKNTFDYSPPELLYQPEPLPLPPPPTPVYNIGGGTVGMYDPMTHQIQPTMPGMGTLYVDPGGGFVRNAMGDLVGQMGLGNTMGPPPIFMPPTPYG